MKQTILALIWLFASTPAIAEVCNKVRPAWAPRNGPVNQVEELRLSFAESTGLSVLVLAGLAIALRKRWLTMTASAIIGLIALLNIARWSWLGDPIITFAHNEGCVAPPILSSITFAAVVVGLITTLRRAAKTQDTP